MSIESYQFPSGLRVYADQVPASNTTAIGFLVEVGGLDESEDEAGLSHLIEHVVHQGTEMFPDDEARRAFEEDHMYSSAASTSLTRTYYSARGRQEKAILTGVGSMLLDPLLRDGDIAHEVDIVSREAQMDTENPRSRHYFARLQATVESPYSRPVLGYVDGLDFPPDKVREFQGRFYAPASIAVITAGRLALDTTVACLLHMWPRLEEPSEALPGPRERRPDPVFKQAGELWLPNETRKENVYLGTGVVLDSETAEKMGDHNDFSYIVACQLIHDLVFKELREERRLSYDGSFAYSADWHPNLWTIGAQVTVTPDKVGAAREAIDDAMASAQQAVTDEAINRKIKANLGGMYINADNINWRADSIAGRLCLQYRPLGTEQFFRYYQSLNVAQVRDAIDDLTSQFTTKPRNTIYDALEPPHDDCREVTPVFTKP